MPSCVTKTKGTKTKIEIKKRHTKEQRAVACSKRRPTVFSKAADLCLRGGANMAVFITSPCDNSDVVYSFSGYSPASEIVDCYLNNKSPPKISSNPQSKLGFWWEDPDLYRNCEDLSELNIIEDRLEKMKKHIIACIEKKEKKNLSYCSLVEDKSSCSQIVSSDQNPNLGENQACSQATSSSSSSADQNSGTSLSEIHGELCSMVASLDDHQSHSEKSHGGEYFNSEFSISELVNDNYMFGLNDGFCLDNNHQMNNYEEDDDDIDIAQFLNDEEIDFGSLMTA